MEEKNCEFFMKQLNLVLFKNQPLDSIRDIINPNYVDYNGNNIFHYFSEFSLKKYADLTYNFGKKIITEINYKIILNEYKLLIPLYIKYLDELKCNILSKNKNNQSPLIYSVVQKNYCITKQYLIYLRNMNSLTNDILCDTFNHAINNGDCLRNDCIDLILYILSLAKEKNIRLYDNASLKGKEKLDYLSPIILLCKDYSKYVIAKFYEIVKMKISTMLEKNQFVFSFDQREIEIISKEIINDSKLHLFKFINEVFLPLLNFFISKLNKDISNSKIFNSIFIYLMSFPCFNNISLFVKKYNIDINYQDESGKTALMHLITNKNNIIKISKELYNKTFEYLINNIVFSHLFDHLI